LLKKHLVETKEAFHQTFKHKVNPELRSLLVKNEALQTCLESSKQIGENLPVASIANAVAANPLLSEVTQQVISYIAPMAVYAVPGLSAVVIVVKTKKAI
jgi:hypothetical protein